MKIIHLIDDANLGGVTRGLAQMAACLGPCFDVAVAKVNPRRSAAPRLDADVAVIDWTPSWAKLPFLLALRLRFRGPIVVVEHSYTEAYEQRCVPSRWRFRAMLRLSYAFADRVVAVSRGQARWMREAGLVPAAKLDCIPQAIDTAALGRLTPDTALTGPLRLGAYGRFVPQKGFDTLIEAMRLVPPEVACLEIAGFGPDEAALRAMAAGLPHIRITGRLDGPESFLHRVQVVVIPSRWEAYGLVGQEARAAARPIVASDLDGLREQVDPRWGLLTPAETPAALAHAIHALASQPLGAMAEAARASVKGDWARKGEQWKTMLLGLFAPSRHLTGRNVPVRVC